MVIKKVFPVLLMAFFLNVPHVFAQVGITSVPFLQIEPDSRAAGMGNTGVAIADNASAVFWNPAGLAFQKGNQVNITHSKWLPNFNADLFYDYLVGEYHVDGIGTFGGHITYLNLGQQLRTGPSYDPKLDNNLGHFNSYEFAIGLSYGYQLNKNWSVGTGLRYIHSSLADGQNENGQKINPGSTVSFDLATLYKSDTFDFSGRNASINAGLNISNIGPGVNYTSDGNKDPLPTVLRFGWAFTTTLDHDGVHTITIANDISKVLARGDSTGSDGPFQAIFDSWGPYKLDSKNPNAPNRISTLQQFRVGTGLEYWYDNLFALRAGYYFEDPYNGNRRFVTLGAGIKYDFVGVNFSYVYALQDQQPLANTTRFGLLLDF